MKLSIIIVNWNTKDLTRDAIQAAYDQTHGFPFEIILVDNASSDGSMELFRSTFPDVVYIQNTENLGFGKANNQGMRIAKGDFIMLLNSDTVIIDGALNKLVQYLDEHPDAMMVGPKVLNGDRTFQHACRRKLPTMMESFYHLFGLIKIFKKSKKINAYKRYTDDPNVTEPAEALSGAAMMFRSEVFEKTGGFDERFFMYGEDLDLCKQVQDHGWKTMFVHTAEIIHFGGASSKKRRTKSIKNFYQAMWVYYKKHFYTKHNPVFRLVAWLGIYTKMEIVLLINVFKRV